MTPVYLIGGSISFGSGKVVAFLRKGLAKQGLLAGFVETQGARLNILTSIWSIPRGSTILFQPSICLPGFLRDVLLVLVARLKGLQITFILMVDVAFKNPLLRNIIMRRLFFGRSTVLALAECSLPIPRVRRVPPYFDDTALTRLPEPRPDAPIALLHLGYRNAMKGWDDLIFHLTKENHPHKVIAIGAKATAEEALTAVPVTLMPGAVTLEIEAALQSVNTENFPVYVFLSREDFAPLMVLEAGAWGIPVATLRGTRAYDILARMLPTECFVVVASLSEIEAQRANLIKARVAMDQYVANLKSCNLLDAVLDYLEEFS